VSNVFTDYQKLLAMDEIDAVDVCLHNALHCPATLDAFAAGKHVLLRKAAGAKLEGSPEDERGGRQAGKHWHAVRHHLQP